MHSVKNGAMLGKGERSTRLWWFTADLELIDPRTASSAQRSVIKSNGQADVDGWIVSDLAGEPSTKVVYVNGHVPSPSMSGAS